jgi:hypothetical protein
MSPSRNLGCRTWFGPRQASTSISLAALALLSTTLSAVDPEPPILPTASAERVFPPGSFRANESQPERLSAALESKLPSEFQSEDVLSRASIAAPQTASSGILPSSAPTPEPEMDEVNQYLWNVYQRTETKRDGSGDFTWKDIAAAKRLGMSLGDYVVRGMDRDFREVLYRAGLAMDAVGIHWTILSAFRDDYRQSLASGYKAASAIRCMGEVRRPADMGMAAPWTLKMAMATRGFSGTGSMPTVPTLISIDHCPESTRHMCCLAGHGMKWRPHCAMSDSARRRLPTVPRLNRIISTALLPVRRTHSASVCITTVWPVTPPMVSRPFARSGPSIPRRFSGALSLPTSPCSNRPSSTS